MATLAALRDIASLLRKARNRALAALGRARAQLSDTGRPPTNTSLVSTAGKVGKVGKDVPDSSIPWER